MAVKPNEGSYVDNAIKWGVAGLNILESRIPCNQKAEPHKKRNAGTLAGGGQSLFEKYGDNPKFPVGKYSTDTPVGKIRNEERMADEHPDSRYPSNLIIDENVVDELGAPSRFFYCAKASKEEREMGCDKLEIKQAKGGGTNNTPDDVCGKYGSIKSPSHNHHLKLRGPV